jgi:NADH-quinone oxidoreductase subunit J
MGIISILFYVLAAVAVVAALAVVFAKSPVYSVLSLVVSFFAIAGEYILLNAQFLAAVHIIVYAGAIMVLFLFVIMLLNLNETNSDTTQGILPKIGAIVGGGLLFLVIIAATRSAAGITPAAPANLEVGLIKNLGNVLFTEFLLPFELSSLLFLSAMIGAVMLGKRENS